MIIDLDWNSLLETINLQQGKSITISEKNWNLNNPEYMKILESWKGADFNFQSIGWINYYPGTHFKTSWVQKAQERLCLQGVHRSWISRINPGYYAPWHWDIDDNVEAYKQKGEILRYSIFIGHPNRCHVFVTETSCNTMQKQGTCIKWKSYDEWHAGMNAGLQPKFMFHIIGY